MSYSSYLDDTEEGSGTSRTPLYSWKTPHDSATFKWAINASKSAITEDHVDAAAFPTWLRMIKGKKVWMIKNMAPMSTPRLRTEGVEQTDPWYPFQHDDGKWFLVMLKEQDDLCVPFC